MNPQINEHGAFYIWIAQEVSTGEILGSYTQKTQAIKHAQSFVGGDESEIISDNSLETVFIGGNIAKVTKVKTETLRVWDQKNEYPRDYMVQLNARACAVRRDSFNLSGWLCCNAHQRASPAVYVILTKCL